MIHGVSVHSNWNTPVASDISTDHSLNSKCTHATINWYISTSNSGVVGGSGACSCHSLMPGCCKGNCYEDSQGKQSSN